jgi:hypothetical protein
MQTVQPRFWDYAYAVLLAIAIPVAIFHAVQDRWAQAILVSLAAVGGAIVLITGWNRTEPAPTPAPETGREPGVEDQIRSTRIDLDQQRDSSGRFLGWLPMGAVSGFVATGVMTAAVLIGYGISALFASDAAGAHQLQVWFASLIDNTLTEIATVNLALAIGLHLVAGIGWAVVYAGFIEPRVSGTGMQRGIKFGLIPWLLSVAVFFPIAGVGFFGANIGAGPLPVLGNLILHLVYGAALGKIYASHAVWQEPVTEVSQYNLRVLDRAHRSMAIALIPGALLGLAVGVIVSTAFVTNGDLFMAGVLGAVVGSAFGVWIGSLAGLSPEVVDSNENARA